MLRRKFLGCMLAPVVMSRAQTAPASPAQADGNIQVQVNVVNVAVTVTDAQERFVTDLDKNDFSVWEDGKQVDLRYFSSFSSKSATRPASISKRTKRRLRPSLMFCCRAITRTRDF